MVLELQRGGHEVDRKLDSGKIQLFKGSEPMLGNSHPTPADLSSESEEENDMSKDEAGMLLKSQCLSQRHGISFQYVAISIRGLPYVGLCICISKQFEFMLLEWKVLADNLVKLCKALLQASVDLAVTKTRKRNYIRKQMA